MGVGYVIGPRIAGVMFAGGVLSWLVLLPLLSIMGNYMTVPFPPVPASGLRIDQMGAGQLWSAYIRYTGAGAVLAAGLITLARTIPTIVSSFSESVREFSASGSGAAAGRARTDRDLPLSVVLVGSLTLALFLALAPGMPLQYNFLAAILDRRLRLLLRDGLLADHRPYRQLVEPDFRDDDRDADPDLHDLRCRRLDGGRLRAGGTGSGRGGLHRGGDCRRDVPGPEDRLPRGRNARLSTDRPGDRRARIVVHHRHDDAVPALRIRHWLAVAVGARRRP